DFSDGCGAGARNNEVRRGILLVKIVKECPHIRVEPGFGVGQPDFLNLFLTGLVDKFQITVPVFEVGQTLAYCAVDGLRTLAAAKNKNRKWRQMRFRRNGFELGSN